MVWGSGRPRLSHLNVGTGEDVTIRELAEAIARVTGYTGLRSAYEWYRGNREAARG